MWRRIEEIIRRVVREELERALVRDITVETRRSDPGNPQLKTERMSVLDYLIICSNHTEGAVRGMQADVGRNRNLLMELGNQTCQTFKTLADAFNSPTVGIEGDSDVKRLSRHSEV